jgi:lysophospholipase L1-like esterase
VLATLLARWPRVSGALLVLAAVDFTWGIGSRLLASPHGLSLLPPAAAEPARFQYHPLLQAVPIPGLAITSLSGLAIRHSSQGTRGSDPDPARLATAGVVATYGGSGTYDLGVGEGQTWPGLLDEALRGDGLIVVNHGVPGYSTVENLLQTAFYADKFGKAPRCAVYFIGWNDVRNAHVPDLDAGYADFHLQSQVDSQKVRRIGGSNVTFSPLITVLARLVAAEVDTVRYAKDPYALPPVSGNDPAVASIFERNVRSISAINRSRGTSTIWVGQILDRDRLNRDGIYGWAPRVRDRELWSLLQQSNALLERTAQALGDTYVALPVDSFSTSDFVDEGHFSAAGSRRFAALLAPVVRATCR